jgi:hypothetical protein
LLRKEHGRYYGAKRLPCDKNGKRQWRIVVRPKSLIPVDLEDEFLIKHHLPKCAYKSYRPVPGYTKIQLFDAMPSRRRYLYCRARNDYNVVSVSF